MRHIQLRSMGALQRHHLTCGLWWQTLAACFSFSTLVQHSSYYQHAICWDPCQHIWCPFLMIKPAMFALHAGSTLISHLQDKSFFLMVLHTNVSATFMILGDGRSEHSVHESQIMKEGLHQVKLNFFQVKWNQAFSHQRSVPLIAFRPIIICSKAIFSSLRHHEFVRRQLLTRYKTV